jgi:hypothetical protein
MSAQEWIVAAIGAVTVGYLVWRAVRRRLTSTCCGERECPATRRVLEQMRGSRKALDVSEAEQPRL